MLKENCSIKYIIRKNNKSIKYQSLFLMIHGYGSNEKNLFSFEKDIPENLFVISIRGIYRMDEDKYYWYNIDFSNDKKFINKKQAKNSINNISHFINYSIKKYNLKKDKVWLCGFSQGAILSYAIALKNNKVKNVLSLSGYLDEEILPKKIYEINNIFSRKINFFISHGKYDNIIPVEWVRKSIKLLNNEKLFSIFYKEYDSEHNINDSNYIDLINWIKSK
ncbi:alpha/beta hydrolase [Blattabacterium cuenoti]|uniref:alpha/beta hydrolase n=1 Tax=Blattabacterium cuenoti TaxID=1653831 RepID=UPI00163CB593|nr:dienelactone hydrolase family protein [Blattabacterium cuenoti]